MTTKDSWLGLVEAATDLAAGLADSERYNRLFAVAHRVIPFDSAAILKLQGDLLIPVAAMGLDPGVLGRRFKVEEHPRLQALMQSNRLHLFPADSDLPDPYDGLIEGTGPHLDVHACMGSRLDVHGQPWGVITFDALEAGAFDNIDPVISEAFTALAAVSAATGNYINDLETRNARNTRIIEDLSASHAVEDELIGDSEIMRGLLKEIELVATTGFTVLITGETGTGKELVAKRLHKLSTRSSAPLIQVNCAALPESLAESELFGHLKGAFTGASQDRLGKFSLADGGTLFLDEVGELPLALQAKLLRALQSGEVQRVGADSIRHVDVRVIAATNRDLATEVKNNRFRADLFQRLSVYPITVPPLCNRRDDIPLLSGYFLERLARELGRHQITLSKEAQDLMQSYDWPGNVRELQHVLSRTVLRAPRPEGKRGIRIEASWLGLGNNDRPVEVEPMESASESTLAEMTENYQRKCIIRALEKAGGNRSRAARQLGLDRSNFHRLSKRLGI